MAGGWTARPPSESGRMPTMSAAKLPLARRIRCPHCGGPTRVTKTRRACRGLVIRTRRCPACGRAFKTHDRPHPRP